MHRLQPLPHVLHYLLPRWRQILTVLIEVEVNVGFAAAAPHDSSRCASMQMTMPRADVRCAPFEALKYAGAMSSAYHWRPARAPVQAESHELAPCCCRSRLPQVSGVLRFSATIACPAAARRLQPQPPAQVQPESRHCVKRPARQYAAGGCCQQLLPSLLIDGQAVDGSNCITRPAVGGIPVSD
jgi:hypothetical protein